MISARRILSAALFVAVASCADQPSTAPVRGASAQRLVLPAPTIVNVVTRNTALPAPVSATATIGALGGRISIPSAGLSVVVPPGALLSATRITATALAGNQVAYEFEPHGIKFLVPLLVTQNLVGTSANTSAILNLGLQGGYFADPSALDPAAGTGLVTELLGASVSLLTRTATFPVFHFSGYIVATGCQSSDDGSSE